jgi:DNA modification methylase
MNKQEVLLIDPKLLEVNSQVGEFYSTPENYNEIKLSIINSGILEPLVVSSDNVIISGGIRHQVALELKMETVPVIYSDKSSDLPLTILHNQQRIKKYSEILNEYEQLKQKYSIIPGARTDLNKDLKQNKESLDKSIPITKSKLSRLISINRMSNDLYGVENEKTKKIWEDIDSRKKSVDSVYKSLLKRTKEKENESVVPKEYPFIKNNVKIYNKSCELMSDVESESIACVISSPPYHLFDVDYGNGKDERGREKSVDEYIKNLVNDYQDCKRVLNNDGSLWVNINDCVRNSGYSAVGHRFVLAMIENGWTYNDELVWIKRNPTYTHIKGGGGRSVRAHEYIFQFTKSKDFYYDTDWMKYVEDDSKSTIYGCGKDGAKLLSSLNFRDGILKTNVANIEKFRRECKEKKGFNLTHSATFPIDVPTVCLLSTSRPFCDTILDTHSGTGTTGESALIFGRNYIGYELNPEFIMASEVRLSKYFTDTNEFKQAA